MPDDDQDQGQQPDIDALRSQLAAKDEEIRKTKLGAMLERIGAPGAYADIYKGELDPEKVRAFVQSLQVATSNTTNSQEPPASNNAAQAWGRYEGASNAGTPTGGEPDEVERLLRDGAAAIAKAHPQINPFQVSEEDKQAQREYAAKVNNIHREWERGVRRRQLEPAYHGLEGFGGRMDPPDYAYRAMDRELIS